MYAQQVPGLDENIPYLINFGKSAASSFGDDDHAQAFYFVIPEKYDKPFFIRVYDPETSGSNDEIIGAADTKTKFSVFGGSGIYKKVLGVNAHILSEKPTGDILAQKMFSNTTTYENKWYSFGPFNPSEGEYVAQLNAYVFKILCVGLTGNDGNCFKYFLSSQSNHNLPIVGGNAFTFEYTVRLHDSKNQTSHLYPFIDNKVIKVNQMNFDADATCRISLFSKKKIGELALISKDAKWINSTHVIYEQERESCMDFRVRNNYSGIAPNNNVVFRITNQYGEALPFMSVPIGEFSPKKQTAVIPD